jgi:hypothetical protein
MITLTRFAYSPMGVFGRLTFEDFSCYTVERPWENNIPRVSCIPEGVYTLKWYDSPRFGRTLAVDGNTVSVYQSRHHQRSAILIHPANTIDDLLGCIGLGYVLGFYKDKWAVLNSRKATTDFLEIIRLENSDDFKFKITNNMRS